MTAKKIRHYLQFKDFSLDDYEYLLERARILKRKFKNYETYHPLHDRTLAMIFEKNSTRTRLSFEAGIFQLGGHAVFMNTRDTQLGRGEPIEDSAQVISRMVDIIMIRTFGQDIIQRFAESSRVPVINGLTNEYHPCQVLADIFTYYEHRGPIHGKTVAWVGDANNMLYYFDSSRDYDPSPHLGEITAPVLAINSADDQVNPPELGIVEPLVAQVKHGKFIMIPIGPDTRGHGTHSLPAVWGHYLKDFLATLPER